MKHHPGSWAAGHTERVIFASCEYAQEKRWTRREKFLAENGAISAVVAPRRIRRAKVYLTSGRVGRQPVGVPLALLQMYFLQHWFGLADATVQDPVYSSHAMRELSASTTRAWRSIVF